MRSILFLGILALGGCDAIWGWRLTSCNGSSASCPGGDLSGSWPTDLAGVDIAGLDLPGPPADLTPLPVGFISLGSRHYPSGFNAVLLGGSDSTLSVYTQGPPAMTTPYTITTDPASPIYGVADINVSGSNGFLAMTGDGRLFSRQDSVGAGKFVLAQAVGKSLYALWMSSPQYNFMTSTTNSFGWAVGQAGTVVSVLFANGNPTITSSQQLSGGNASANLLGVDAIDMQSMGMGTPDMAIAGPSGQAWAVGENGVILQFDGSAWVALVQKDYAGSLPTGTLNAVSHASDGTVLAVGNNGLVVRRAPDGYWRTASAGAGPLYGVAAISSGEGIAVGGNGSILRFDGTSWTPEQAAKLTAGSRTSATLRSIKCYNGGSSDCWVVGDGPILLHYDGISWQRVLTG